MSAHAAPVGTHAPVVVQVMGGGAGMLTGVVLEGSGLLLCAAGQRLRH